MKRIRRRKGPVLHHPSRPTPEQIRQRIAAVRPDVLTPGGGNGRYVGEHLEGLASECATFSEFKRRAHSPTTRLMEVWQLVKGKV